MSTSDDEMRATLEQMERDSAENFAIRINPDRFDGINVLITHNGYQWSGFTVANLDELQDVYEAIEHYLCQAHAS